MEVKQKMGGGGGDRAGDTGSPFPTLIFGGVKETEQAACPLPLSGGREIY
jgi:hypothetical protein